ncbi:MAG: hypothetical protein Q4A37_02990 [Candidatus Saccharibacteria bacterium]|nr:hypothetical protein [Candidatus Saccharibacteria bacterium]
MKFNQITINRLLYRLRHDYLTLNNVVVATAFLIALGWVWGSIEAMQRNYELQQMVVTKRRQVEVETLQVALLGYEGKYYESTEYLDMEARRRFGLGTPGEKQLIVPSTDETTTKEAAQPPQTTPTSNFQQWMNLLFGGRVARDAKRLQN